jgi:uncharacterized protein (TIGR03086 family)
MGRMTDDPAEGSVHHDAMPDVDGPHAVIELIEAGRDREAAERGAAARQARDGGPMHPIAQLEELAPHLGGVVGGITPDQLDDPTPCAGFTVRGVLQHMVGGAAAFAAAYRGEEPNAPDLTDPLGGFASALGGLVAAIREPGALDRTIDAPFGEVSGETFARFVALDGLVHGWDLATATGQAYEPPDTLVAAATEFARATIDPLRDGDTFADAVVPAADASAIERLANLTGRHRPATTRSGR